MDAAVAFVALVLSSLIAALGALGVVSPGRLLGVVRSFQTPAGLYAAAALRLVLGAALFLAAPGSRAPEVIRILGVIIFVAGVITPFFGLERFRRLLTWWSEQGQAFIRAWAGFALAIGLLLAYSVAPTLELRPVRSAPRANEEASHVGDERRAPMQPVHLDGVELEYDAVGSGEPLLLIHGGLIADAFLPLLAEPRLASSYRVISYHRRGYAGSSRATAPFTIGQQAADARALLRHLGIPHAHVAGHSYGGAIAIQLSLDAPDLVGTLALLEPALASAAPSGPMFQETLAPIQSMYQRGDRAGATDAFLVRVLGPDYRPLLEKFLPPGAFELAVADSDTPFQVELKALQEWSFTADNAARLRQPVLSVIGEESEPIFHEIHSVLQQWIPHAEELVVPQANHALPYMNPRAVADGLARFLDRHRL